MKLHIYAFLAFTVALGVAGELEKRRGCAQGDGAYCRFSPSHCCDEGRTCIDAFCRAPCETGGNWCAAGVCCPGNGFGPMCKRDCAG